MKWVFAVLLSIVATVAFATVDGWPALYDVTGVAADDNLNVREQPNASSIVISTLPPMAENIEVIAVNEDETWGLINIDGGTGWVSLRFMARQPEQFAGYTPAITVCHGTEPFWALEIEDDNFAFSAPDVTGTPTPLTVLRSANRIDRFALISDGITGVVSTQACNDGMSEMQFGLSIDLLAPLYGETQLLSGCCSIQP
ncbi:SH3 domain-containing protein [Octadecabacter sp. 1_MG-2023]|uniref:SH3 domain-containing protein n=1 Tax=unclassified Octadecabacter TaxID=196158 RepID=UPI001C07F7BE|nr:MULTISPECIES: SH3 domain-containing protein [unclassified Octadecabacter]MBU2992259.1 SH3 domain-containing protein [Octadecabacter sp. B2R22]MDO6734985.1 SH3 domain-containing protein [Octadecabacter sp. 1_MG-2023]